VPALPALAYNCRVNGSTNRLTPSLAGIGIPLVLTGCGSAGNTRTATTTASSASPALEYVKCLRAHGVPSFPDPGPGGRLASIPSDIDTAAPAFRFAQGACANLVPGGTAGPSSKGSRQALLADAECMRRHGLANFPDPTPTPPPPPPPGERTGNAVGGSGAYLVLPPTSPAVSRAEAACGLRLP
jgi:hypothetical protein